MMGIQSGWDAALLAVAAFLAVVVLVRLMLQQRDTIVAKLRSDIAQEQQRQKAENRKKKGGKGRQRAA